jgi:homoserine O-acetyltransferase
MAFRLRRLFLAALLSVGAIGLFGSIGSAQDANRKDGDFVVRNFQFQNGEILPELRLHYVTLGTPKRDAAGHVTNAVLLLHATNTDGNAILANLSSQLFGGGQPLDSAKYYLIIPDAIGHGASSKPSDGLRAKFPHYGYNDMVEAQHRVVTEGLGVDHLRLVIGLSMGGMHTWLWGEKYPNMMDALMPFVSQPVQIAGHNFLWRRVIIETIRNDPEWNGGDYIKQPSHWHLILPLHQMMVNSRTRLYATAPTRGKSNELFDKMVGAAQSLGPTQVYDANNFLYAYEASSDYDPEPNLGKIKARLLSVNFADDMINAAELGVVERAIAKIPNARSVNIPGSDQSYAHLNSLHPEIWKAYLIELLQSLS